MQEECLDYIFSSFLLFQTPFVVQFQPIARVNFWAILFFWEQFFSRLDLTFHIWMCSVYIYQLVIYSPDLQIYRVNLIVFCIPQILISTGQYDTTLLFYTGVMWIEQIMIGAQPLKPRRKLSGPVHFFTTTS